MRVSLRFGAARLRGPRLLVFMSAGSALMFAGTAAAQSPGQVAQVTPIYSFVGQGLPGDGGRPSGALVQTSDGRLQGTTATIDTLSQPQPGGSLFALNPDGTMIIRQTWTSDTANLASNLVVAPDGTLYGTAARGGWASDVGDGGSIFKVDANNVLTVLHRFGGPNSADGNGIYPGPVLVRGSDGSLYGTTLGSGPTSTSGSGTIFRLDPSGTLTTLHVFTHEEYQGGTLVGASDGRIYGTTWRGGAFGCGTIFRLEANGELTTIYTFTGSEGRYPSGPLLEARGGGFYGTTATTIFKLDTTGTLTTLHNFVGGDEGFPNGGAYGPPAGPPNFSVGGLVETADGSVYGMTSNGGTTYRFAHVNYGTIYRVDPLGAFTTIYAFNGPEGALPQGGLMQAADGALYGTTTTGGAWQGGTVFRLSFRNAGPLDTYMDITPPNAAFGDATTTLSVSLDSPAKRIGPGQNPYATGGKTVTLLLNGHEVGTAVTDPAGFASLSGVSLAGLAYGSKNTISARFDGDALQAPVTAFGPFLLKTGSSNLTWNRPSNIAAGVPLSAAQLNATAATAGTFTYTPAAGKVFSIGNYTLSVTFTPFNSNYNTATLTVPLSVKANPGIVWPTPAAITAGTTLSATQLNATATVAGSFVYSPFAIGATMPAGTYTLSATFTPLNLTAYAPATAKVTLSVKPALSVLTYPANGAVGADLALPMQWTTVPDAQAYYLYVGSSVGAKNFVDTGETLQTSRLVSVPAGVVVYARLWTKRLGAWQYSDSSFTATGGAASLTSALTYPANGAVNADLTLPLQWTSVAGAQAYYLYVGSTVGAKNLLDTGETLQTSRIASLPAGQTLFARLWTKIGGVWRYVDSTFTAAALTTTLTYPLNGALRVDLSVPIQWTAVPGAQAYYLYLGSTVGAKDLVNTGEIAVTARLVSLPAGQTIYARMWVKVGGIWRYTDSTFGT